MKLLKKIDNVINFICTTDGRIYYNRDVLSKDEGIGDSIFELNENEEEILILNDSVSYLMVAHDSWTYVKYNHDIIIHNPMTGENKEYNDYTYYYRLMIKWYDTCVLIADKKDKTLENLTFIVDANYSLKQLPFYSDLLFKDDALNVSWGKLTVSRRRLDGELLWENELTSHSGKDEIDLNNICISEKLNRIYLPTMSGYLNCLDAETGEIIWETVNYRENGLVFVGRYSIWDKYIYAGGGDRLLEIDAISGKCIRILNLKKELWPKLKDSFKDDYMFFISGIVHAYEDVIILYTTSPSRIIIIDRESFTMKDNIIIPDSVGIPYSTSLKILWHNKKLYLNDTGDKFYVFK